MFGVTSNIVNARQSSHQHHGRPNTGYSASTSTAAGNSGGGGSLGNLLDGVQLNLLDAKLIGQCFREYYFISRVYIDDKNMNMEKYFACDFLPQTDS